MKNRSSKIWKIDKKVLQKLLNESTGISGVLEKLGFHPYTGNHRTLNKRILEDKLDLSRLKENRLKQRKTTVSLHPLKSLLIEHSKYHSNNKLKRRLIEAGLLKNKCRDCNNEGIWNGKKLSLQLEHINGINDDNRLKNLCLLCPNCHSQTETFSGKNSRKNKRV